MEWIIYAGCALVICAISVYLIIHQDYEDELVGRIALFGMTGGEFIVILEAVVEGSEYEILPTTFVIQASLTLFMVRHCYRFLRWKYSGKHEWRKANK